MTVLLVIAAVIVVLAIATAVIAWAAVMLALIRRLPPDRSTPSREAARSPKGPIRRGAG